MIHGLLGQIIAFPIQRALNQDPPLPWKILVETKSRLEDSEQHLSRAVELLEDHQDREGLHNVLVNRAAVRGMLGKLEEGLEDCNRVLSENPEENVAIRNKGIMLFHLSRSSESITAFEKLRGTKDWSNVALMVASSYYDINEPRNSVETIEPLWEPDRQDHHELLTSHFLIKAYHKLSDRNAVGRVIEIIKAKWPNDPEALLVLGQHKYQDGDVDDAFELMREGMSYAQNNQRDRIALQLAESLYQQKRYAEAAEIYEGIVDTTANDSTFRAYLTSLFNAGYYLDALKLARTARGDGLPIPVVSEVEVLVLELIGDLEQAENILTGLVDLEPRKALHKLRLANAKLRRRESEAAKEVIQLIEYEDMKDDAQTLIEVALMRRITGLGEGLPLVYRARRIDFNNPEVHVAYVQYFLDVEQGEELDFRPAIADIDCTVHLKRGGQRRIYTILDEDPLEASRGELSPNNSLATRLIGKKKGDTINLKEELGCVDIWCIMDTCQRLNYAMNNGRKSLNFCAHAQTSTLERRTIAGATSRPSCGWHEVVLLGDCCLSTTVTGTAYISASHAGVKRVYGNECISILCKTPIWEHCHHCDSTVVRAHPCAAGASKKTVANRPKLLAGAEAGSVPRST